jgi:hypothetical protein
MIWHVNETEPPDWNNPAMIVLVSSVALMDGEPGDKAFSN